MSGLSFDEFAPAVSNLIRLFGPQALNALLDGLKATDMGLAIFDPDDRLIFSCPTYREMFDVQEGEQTFASIMRHCHAARKGVSIETDDMDAWLRQADARRRSRPNRKFEIDMLDGRWMWASETTYNGGWLLLMVQDFTSLKLKEIHLENARDAALQAAETDPLTELANRRAIMRYFEECVAMAGPDAPLSIALVDIDHFKQINDTLGHDTGDEVLRHFGRHCGRVFRNSDRVGRVGGEEFLIVMPNTGEAAASSALQRFRHRLHRANQLIPKRLAFTFSAGVAQWRPGRRGTDLYRSADRALYRAKADGRDTITTETDLALATQCAAGQRGL